MSIIVTTLGISLLYNWLGSRDNTTIDVDITADESQWMTVEESWLANNLYHVSSYKKNEDGTYSVVLLRLSDDVDCTFEELITKFESTPFNFVNGRELSEGVNCQGMTSYIADWCVAHNIPYAVEYFEAHTDIIVHYTDGKDYKFNFGENAKVKVIN